MRLKPARVLVAGTLAAALPAAFLGATTAPAAAADNVCSSVTADVAPSDTERPSPPYEQLHVAAARDVVDRFAPRSGPPVRVAVLDSGVLGAVGERGPVTVRARTTLTGNRELTYYHGTTVAGLIAGRDRPSGKPVGIAPDAEIVDVRVYDGEAAGDDSVPVSSASVARGLAWVAEHAGALNIRVANVSVAVPASDELAAAVRRVRRAGVLVVAPTGNRPAQGEEFDEHFDDGRAAPDEDAATVIYPAGYDEVLAVGSTADGDPSTDLLAAVLKNSQTDVAVPTFDAVSYGLNGASCVIEPLATSWAAAEVSGVLALLWQRFPDDTDEQVLARLVNTANGTTDRPTPLTGAGVVQPYEALTRPLAPSAGGAVERSATRAGGDPRASAPEPDPDLFAGTRDDAVWWGLIGGGVLVVALLLRPVLSRRP